jgi:pyrroline-5-carboxylate reductase
MGPTYLWFQWQELRKLAEEMFGMTSAEAQEGMAEMISGAASALFKSGMSPEEVMDLIPVKPLGEEEQIIRAMYKSKLAPLYEKLKS